MSAAAGSGRVNDATPLRGVSLCSECGCPCQNCVANGGFEYQQEEIEKLRCIARSQQCSLSRLESDMQTEAVARSREQHRVQEELARLRDRYDRLLDSHKKLSRLNGGLEDRLLGLAERLQAEQASLAECQRRLAQSEAETRAAVEEADRLRQLPPPPLPDAGFLWASFPSPAGPSQPPAAIAMASVSVPLPTFPPTFAHVSVPSPGAARFSPHRQPPLPQPHRQLEEQQLAKPLASGSAVLHL